MLSRVIANRAEYGEFESRLALFSNAIGHPSRVAIILAIVAKNNLVEGEMLQIEGLDKTQVQKHLSELQRAGFIDGRIVGLKRSYSVNLDAIAEFVVLFKKFKIKLAQAKTN